jgi:hypothetical protein
MNLSNTEPVFTFFPKVFYINILKEIDFKTIQNSIHIFKTAAPIKGFSGKVGVSFDKQYAS